MPRPPAISRAELDRVALGLFLAHGYAAVSVADITATAGISRPTFFRYVDKRADLVLDHVAGFGAEVAAGLLREPRREWGALTDAMVGALEGLEPDSATGRAFRVLRHNPGIRCEALGLTRTWRRQLIEALIRRGDYGADPARCAAAAAMAIGLAQLLWADEDGRLTPRLIFSEATQVVRGAG